MSRKKTTVRLRCVLDDGKTQHAPGTVVELAGELAASLIASRAAEAVVPVPVKKVEEAGKPAEAASAQLEDVLTPPPADGAEGGA